MFETIRIETDARGVAHLWLAREDKHNALSAQMIRELTRAAGQLGVDPSVRVVVLAARGKSFCAGGDLGWMQDQMQADAGFTCLLGQRFKHGHGAADCRDQFIVLGGAVVHEGSNANEKNKDIP